MRGMGFEGFEKAKKGLIFVLKMMMNTVMREIDFYYSFYYFFYFYFIYLISQILQLLDTFCLLVRPTLELARSSGLVKRFSVGILTALLEPT